MIVYQESMKNIKSQPMLSLKIEDGTLWLSFKKLQMVRSHPLIIVQESLKMVKSPYDCLSTITENGKYQPMLSIKSHWKW